MDAIAYSEKPIILSHAGARALWDSRRLMTDEVLRACAEHGGVIGVEAAPHTTMLPGQPHTIDSVMAHFDYIKELCGIDHVAFGPDTLYGDHVGVHHHFAARLSTKSIQGSGFEEVPYVKGMENPTEASKNILRCLVKRGYSDTDIEKVLGGNVLRVLRENWR
jgi:membrane dipeptidase